MARTDYSVLRAQAAERANLDALRIIEHAISEIVAQAYSGDITDEQWEQAVYAKGLLVDAQNYLTTY